MADSSPLFFALSYLHNFQASAPSSPSLACLPFLPVNPDYGTSRNQARQKLARLDKTEFATLVVDVLKVSSIYYVNKNLPILIIFPPTLSV